MFTQTFNVYSAKKFPGMSSESDVSCNTSELMFPEATDLSKTFADQGLKIRVRKDPRRELSILGAFEPS